MPHARSCFFAVAALGVLVALTSATDSEICVTGDKECSHGDSLVQHAHTLKVAMDAAIEDDEHLVSNETHVRELPMPPNPLDNLFPPVSTTMKCVISVTVQFFLVWTTLAIVTCLPVFCGPSDTLSKIKTVLDEACTTVRFAPMISILMITTRMRAMMVTNNQPDKYGLPPDWCKNGMVLTASCVGIITVAMMIQHCLSGGGSVRDCVSAVQYLAMLAMYIGFAIVSFGLYTMDVPKELGESVPMSTTANCVMGLTVYYFLVQVIRQISTTLDVVGADAERADTTDRKGTITKAAEAALKALDYAPMVCILFLAARMRSLQLGLDAPQLWARIYFSTTYYSIVAFMILSAVKTFLGSAHKATIICIETVCLVVMYVSIVAVLISIFTIEPADGSPAPPISTAVRCVMLFTAQYFLAYILEFAFEQLHELRIMESRFLVDLFKRTQETVMFAPMLSCLFVATRMQALQMTDNKGAPQGWVQDCMMLSQWALVIQLVLVVVEHCAGGSKDGGGCEAVTAVIRNICLFLLHGGVIGVIKGVFEMRKENADGTGQLIPGFVIPGRLSGSTGR